MSDLSDEQAMHDDVYTNTYSLWGNSKFYDIKNLSPQNFAIGTSEISCEFKASRWSASPSEVKAAPETPDIRNRRTVDRESLYEDPDTFQIHNELNDESPSRSPTLDWTQFYWHKATEKHQEGSSDGAAGSSWTRKQQAVGTNRIQKKLEKMIAKPVKMSKAESMMQKMGWQGGALGKSGDGIVEPIAPNAVYAKKKIGFGQTLNLPKNKKADSKHFFEMNVLLNIYEFIKNNSAVELLFDKTLKKEERKQIHQLVQFKIQADDLTMVDFNSTAQMDLILQISEINCYVLTTQSTGVYPHRQLCLYKEAPQHVYLIIPEDLRDDEYEEEPIETQKQEAEELLTVETVTEELEEETNPFLISITRNLKKAKSDSEYPEDIPVIPEKPEDNIPEESALPEEKIIPDKSKIMDMIVEYFDEFARDKRYSEFKFLGPFSEEEISAINEFLEEGVKYLSEMECPLASVFKKIEFEINEDCTGNTVIYKRPV